MPRSTDMIHNQLTLMWALFKLKQNGGQVFQIGPSIRTRSGHSNWIIVVNADNKTYKNSSIIKTALHWLVSYRGQWVSWKAIPRKLQFYYQTILGRVIIVLQSKVKLETGSRKQNSMKTEFIHISIHHWHCKVFYVYMKQKWNQNAVCH